MGDVDVKQAGWKLVEVGRVVNIRVGKDLGKLAAVVEIIDPGRVGLKVFGLGARLTFLQILIDGPSKKEGARVQRQAIAVSKIQLTTITID